MVEIKLKRTRHGDFKREESEHFLKKDCVLAFTLGSSRLLLLTSGCYLSTRNYLIINGI